MLTVKSVTWTQFLECDVMKRGLTLKVVFWNLFHMLTSLDSISLSALGSTWLPRSTGLNVDRRKVTCSLVSELSKTKTTIQPEPTRSHIFPQIPIGGNHNNCQSQRQKSVRFYLLWWTGYNILWSIPLLWAGRKTCHVCLCAFTCYGYLMSTHHHTLNSWNNLSSLSLPWSSLQCGRTSSAACVLYKLICICCLQSQPKPFSNKKKNWVGRHFQIAWYS